MTRRQRKKKKKKPERRDDDGRDGTRRERLEDGDTETEVGETRRGEEGLKRRMLGLNSSHITSSC